MAKTIRGLLFFGMAVLTVVGNISNNVTVSGMETTPDQLDIQNVATIPNVTEVSEHDDMTQVEEKWHYERLFRKHCRILPDCTKPIIVEFNGTRYDIRKHVCLWQNENQNCPYLCVIAKGRECLGKPKNMTTCRQCYDNCNRTHPTFSEPFGNYWTICNSTEEMKTTTHQSTTTTTVQPETSTTSQTTTPPIELNTRAKTDNGSNIPTSTSKCPGCWEQWSYWVLLAFMVLLTFAITSISCLYVGARYPKKVKSRLSYLFPAIRSAAVPPSEQPNPEESVLIEMTSMEKDRTGSPREDDGDDNSNTSTSEPQTSENETKDDRKKQRRARRRKSRRLQPPAEF